MTKQEIIDDLKRLGVTELDPNLTIQDLRKMQSGIIKLKEEEKDPFAELQQAATMTPKPFVPDAKVSIDGGVHLEPNKPSSEPVLKLEPEPLNAEETENAKRSVRMIVKNTEDIHDLKVYLIISVVFNLGLFVVGYFLVNKKFKVS